MASSFFSSDAIGESRCIEACRHRAYKAIDVARKVPEYNVDATFASGWIRYSDKRAVGKGINETQNNKRPFQ
jgi:hypothetical protein